MATEMLYVVSIATRDVHDSSWTPALQVLYFSLHFFFLFCFKQKQVIMAVTNVFLWLLFLTFWLPCQLIRCVTEADYAWSAKTMVKTATNMLGEKCGSYVARDAYFVDFMR